MTARPRTAMLWVAASLAILAGAGVRAQTPRPTLPPPASSSAAAADYDARRAAAARLLIASRFRARQAVLIKDAVRAAAAELSEECLNRAAAGHDMKTCESFVSPTSPVGPRMTATESAMLDEVMAAAQTIYARHFTVAEMDEITRFFRTPVGQRYAADYPQILNEVQARKRDILRRYLLAAASTDKKVPHP
jgi:hypothetical protein